MNIYERKSRWKIWLFLFAAVIIAASLYYTSILAGKIAEDEQREVWLWAQAVENKARLVFNTNQLFQRYAAEEREKVELWATAVNKLLAAEGDEVDPFYFEIFSRNESVPAILVDQHDTIINYRNVEGFDLQMGIEFTEEQKNAFTEYNPIMIENEYNEDQYIYYRNSKLFTDTRAYIREFINTFISEDIINAASVPVILTSGDSILNYANLDTAKLNHEPGYLAAMLREMENENAPLAIDIGSDKNYKVYYKESNLLKQIRIYPYVQFAIIGIFLIIAYIAFNTARKTEQNQVWVGMSKETAHQLGTPISSLMAWVEYLRESGTKPEIIKELEKDVNRLELITERFSKIGSLPSLKVHTLQKVMRKSVDYLKNRASKQVQIIMDFPEGSLSVKISPPLFDWVIENLIKNALDAMGGKGTLSITMTKHGDKVYIDLTDSGKGIPKSKFKTIFQPGYSTKKRGWGLGLSLTKRIINEYHKGKIFVKESHSTGTTFRIILPLVTTDDRSAMEA